MSTPRSLWKLTPKEEAVLALVAAGYGNTLIRSTMQLTEGRKGRSNHSVDNYMNIIYKKLGIGKGCYKRVVAALMYLDLECPFVSRLEPLREEDAVAD